MRPKITIDRRSRKIFFSRAIWNRRLWFLTGAVIVGLVSVAFAFAADVANETFHRLLGQGAWVAFVVAPAGFALIRWLTIRWVPGSQGSGISQALGDAARRRLL